VIVGYWVLTGAVIGAGCYCGVMFGRMATLRRAVARDLARMEELHDLMAIKWERLRFEAERLGLDPPPPFPPWRDHLR